MRTLSLISILLICTSTLHGQDRIITKDKQDLYVQIIEQNDKEVKYIAFSSPDNPAFIIKKSRIEKVEYQNGTIDLMGNQNPRHYRPFGISAGMNLGSYGEIGYFLGKLDYFLVPQVDLQLSLGIGFEGGSYYSLGSNFHLNSTFSSNRLTPYTGLLFGSDEGLEFLRIPLGINYIGKKGLNSAFSISELFYLGEAGNATFFELTVGYSFKY